jgi:hypothetical protein
MRYLKYLFLLPLVGLFSCDLGNDPKPGGTALQTMSGEWWIQLYSEGVDLGVDYHVISTTGAAANNDTDILLDDHAFLDDLFGYPGMRIKTKVDLAGLTFVSGSNIHNYYDDAVFDPDDDPNTKYENINIIEGKVLKDAVTTPGGTKTDSIYVQFEFVQYPGEIYEYAGYRRTGFQEDEH